jgi:DNA-binding winged helix-turn-helix (wHTH) protein
MKNWPSAIGGGTSPRVPIVLAHEMPFRLGVLQIEPALRRVSTDEGDEEIIQQRTMQVLIALARADGAIVTRDDLTISCWSGTVVGDDSINRVIAQLRRLAQGIGGGRFTLETITKVGYRLVQTVPETASTDAPADRTIPKETPLSSEPVQSARRALPAEDKTETFVGRSRWRPPFLLAAMILALSLIGAVVSWRARPPADLPPSVTISGFSALDGVSRTTAQAMEEELRTALQENAIEIDSQFAALQVAGAVRRVGNDLRVTTRLDDRTRGKTLWSGAQDVPEGDAGALTGAMKELSYTLRCGLAAARSRSPRLSEAQIALFFSYCENDRVGDGTQKALAALRSLTRSAPDFAPGWFAIAVVAGDVLFLQEDTALRAEALTAVRRGTAIAPDKGDGYIREAVLLSPSQAAKREQLLRRAVPLDTIDCRCARDFLGDFLVQAGRFREALAVYRDAEADKVGGKAGSGGLTLWRLSMASELTGDRASADAFFTKLEANFGPIPWRRWQRALWRRDWKGSALFPSWAPLRPLAPAWPDVSAALAAGDASARLRAAAKLRAIPPEAHVFTVPGLLAQLGDMDGALAALEASRRVNGPFAAPGRYPGMSQPLVWDPTLRLLWNDPRFAAYLQRAGFIDYWRRTHSRPDMCDEAASPAFCRMI